MKLIKFEKVVFLGVILLVISLNFGLRSNVPEASAALCILKNVYWTQENSRDGNMVQFKIDGQDCSLDRVIVKIRLDSGTWEIPDINLSFPKTGNQIIGDWRVSVSSAAISDSRLYLIAQLQDSSGAGTIIDSRTLRNPFLTVPPPNLGGSPQLDITKFEVTPKQFPANQISAFTVVFKAKPNSPVYLRARCSQLRASLVNNSGTTIYTQESVDVLVSQTEYSFDLNSRYDAKNAGTDAIRGKIECLGLNSGFVSFPLSEPVYITIGSVSTGTGCGTPGQPACKPGQTQTYPFEIPNPLKGGATDFAGLVKIIAEWIFNLAIPIAVAMIVYAGILFLTSSGEPGKITKAKQVLTYAIVGLAIILIGSGFVTLIKSILELGGTGQQTEQGPEWPGPVYGPPAPGAVGNKCTKSGDCFTGLTCKNTICQRATGNFENEPCAGTTSCDAGLSCDRSNPQIIDGQNLGECVQIVGTGGRVGDSCQRDNQCVSGLKCNQICQRSGGNLNGEACLKTSSPSNCQSTACSTIGTAVEGVCVTNLSR